MPLDPIPQLEEVEDVLDGLSSPTALETYEAILPYDGDMVAAAIGKKTLEGGAGGPPSGNAGGDLAGSTYPNPVIANGAVTAAKVAADVATQAELDAHVNDASDAHDASAISILDTAADFTATDVEGALAELQSDQEADVTALSDHIADASDAHDATAISFAPAGTIAASTVQAAIEEVASEAAGIAPSLFDANTVLKADSDDTPVALTMGASTILARLAAGSIVAATPTELRTLLDVPTTGEAVLDSLFDANTVLKADSDNTPAALTMGASTTLARLASGNIVAATAAEMRTLLDVPTTGEAVLDTLYDANTVLAATSDNTPAAVTMAASTVLARLAAGNIVAATVAQMATLLAPALPGYELGYAQVTTDATTTQTTRSSATTWLTAPSITFDGSTTVMIEVSFSALTNSAGASTIVVLWENSTDLGIILNGHTPAVNFPLLTARNALRITPAAGAKVYTARGYVGAASTGTGSAGAGTGATRVPAFIRITRV